MKRRTLCLALATIMIFSLFGCHSPAPNTDADNTSTQVNEDSAPVTPDTNNSTEGKIIIDPFEGIYFTYYGENGSGDLTFWDNRNFINFDQNNSELVEFVKSIDAKVSKRSNLINGETITVTLSYSQEEADRLGVALKTTSKNYTVHGLYHDGSPSSVSDIDLDGIRSALIGILKENETLLSTYVTFMTHEAPDSEGPTPRVVFEVYFIVNDGTNYYYYFTGIGDDGSAIGEFYNNYAEAYVHGWNSFGYVYGDLYSMFGEENVEIVE